MAKTRTSRRKKEVTETILLPDLWVTHYEISRTGRNVNSYYFINVRTRQRFYSKTAFYSHFRRMGSKTQAWLKRETAEEEKDQMCSRCKEIGHNCTTCPYPIIHKINPYAGTRIHRCSRCHYLGHNVRTCLRQLP